MRNSAKGTYYKIIKSKPAFENYLFLPKQICMPILTFRTCNHNLPVETGRWLNIPREDRKCVLCNSPGIADEFHYLFRYKAFENIRSLYIPEKLLTWPNLYKLNLLLCTRKPTELKKIVKIHHHYL